MNRSNTIHIPSLRSFITVTVSLIVTLILLCSFFFYYIRTDRILTTSYEHSVTGQFGQVNQKISDQVDSIDSVIPLYVSNASIAGILEDTAHKPLSSERKIHIEKQMTDLYYSTPLSAKNFTNGIYILNVQGDVFRTSTSASPAGSLSGSHELLRDLDQKEHRLTCRMLPSDGKNLYFIRNLFSGNTGSYSGTFIIAVDLEKWLAYCVNGLAPSWFICLYDRDMNLCSSRDMEPQSLELQAALDQGSTAFVSFQELTLCSDAYFTAVQKLDKIQLTAAVAAPKSILFQDLNDTLKTYVLLLACTVLAALLLAVIVSRAVTRPIDRMIYHINQISKGEQASLPPMKMYREFRVWADALNQMLKQLDIYYNDNFQKQLLLKSSEIRALQSQMNPHFLFNVLNTIAWKAQIRDQEEIYQMIISLGELLKKNTLSKETDYVRLAQEIEYVKFYVYLQQMRFEDKISCVFQVPDVLMDCMVPTFCIQPLVENAIVHGLEPKDGKGRLIVQVIPSDGRLMEISIIDNGIGFDPIPDIRNIRPSGADAHTHVGLCNLDKRLELLFGPDARLRIDSIPEKCTTISFQIPIRTKEEDHDIQTVSC